MKKNLISMFGCEFGIIQRLIRELKFFCARSADNLADLLNILYVSDMNTDAVYAWASKMPTLAVVDDHFGPGWSIEWRDEIYNAWCRLEYARMLGAEGWERLRATFHTTRDHWVSVDVGFNHNESEEDYVEIETDTKPSERFWGDSDEETSVDTRPSKLFAWLLLNDKQRLNPPMVSFAIEAVNGRTRGTASSSDVTTSIDTERRRAAAKAAKAAIEAKAKAAMAAAFSDNDEV